jgi:hypothetical protein
MKRLFDWFTNKYDIFDDETGEWKGLNELLLMQVPPEKGGGVRIVVKHNGDDPQEYMMDLYEGTDYKPDIDPLEMFRVVTEAVDDIMKNMPKE